MLDIWQDQSKAKAKGGNLIARDSNLSTLTTNVETTKLTNYFSKCWFINGYTIHICYIKALEQMNAII